MSLQLDQTVLLAQTQELLFQFRSIHCERDIHGTANILSHWGLEVAIGGLDCVIQDTGFGLVVLLHFRQTTHGKKLLKNQPAHVNRPARWSVVEGVILSHDLVIQHDRSIRPSMADEIFTDDHNGHSCRPDILLGTCVDDTILAHINWLGAEVRRHVGDEATIDCRIVLEFHTLDCFVCADMHIFCSRCELPLRLLRNDREVGLLGGGCQVGFAVFLRFLVGF
mmetsp:Transcript_11095/g.68290  ORF Transcript_11095/g.68290 Transcript_11095/m.68290 type:complete len:223 (-) Transcript_11095:461-1129(-)